MYKYKYKVNDSNILYTFKSVFSKKYLPHLAEDAAYNYYVTNDNKNDKWPVIIHLYLDEEYKHIGSYKIYLDIEPTFIA